MFQGDLILDWFSRAKLYGIPHAIVLVAGSEIWGREKKVCENSGTFYEIQFGAF
jgi:hypothetical protein